MTPRPWRRLKYYSSLTFDLIVSLQGLILFKYRNFYLKWNTKTKLGTKPRSFQQHPLHLLILAGLRDGNLQKISVWIIKSFNTVLWVATARRGWVDSFKFINICSVSADIYNITNEWVTVRASRRSREYFTITISWLKAPTSAFTFKTLC